MAKAAKAIVGAGLIGLSFFTGPAGAAVLRQIGWGAPALRDAKGRVWRVQ